MDVSKFPFEKLEAEKKRLISLRKYEPLVSETDEDLDRLVKIAAFICGTPISLVNLVEANHTIFKASVGTDLKGSPREISFCSKAIQGNGVMEVPDATQDERFQNNPLVTGELKVRFYAGSPLVNKEGMNMGTLCVFDQKPKTLLPEQKEALDTLGRMAVLVIESKKQSQNLQKTNLALVLSLESKLAALEQQIQFCRPFLPQGLADQLGTPKVDSINGKYSEMVILQCKLHCPWDAIRLSSPEKIMPFWNHLYKQLAALVSTYHGVVYRFDGQWLTGIFTEPLATYPFNENALFCALDMQAIISQTALEHNLSDKEPVSTISLHGGKAITGIVGLPDQAGFLITGDIMEESSLICNHLQTDQCQVLLSDYFRNQVKEKVITGQVYHINESVTNKSITVWAVDRNS